VVSDGEVRSNIVSVLQEVPDAYAPVQLLPIAAACFAQSLGPSETLHCRIPVPHLIRHVPATAQSANKNTKDVAEAASKADRAFMVNYRYSRWFGALLERADATIRLLEFDASWQLELPL